MEKWKYNLSFCNFLVGVLIDLLIQHFVEIENDELQKMLLHGILNTLYTHVMFYVIEKCWRKDLNYSKSSKFGFADKDKVFTIF